MRALKCPHHWQAGMPAGTLALPPALPTGCGAGAMYSGHRKWSRIERSWGECIGGGSGRDIWQSGDGDNWHFADRLRVSLGKKSLERVGKHAEGFSGRLRES
jgi:hypothetical protein